MNSASAAAVGVPSTWSWLPDWVSSPPSFVTWLTFLLAAVLAIAKFVGYWRSRSDRSQDKRIRFEDAWFKAIVLDSALPTISKFLSERRAILPAIVVGTPGAGALTNHQQALAEFQRLIESLKSQVQIVAVLSENAFGWIERNLEQLEDAVAGYCAAQDGNTGASVDPWKDWESCSSMFDVCGREIVIRLREIHDAIYRGAKPDEAIDKPPDPVPTSQ